MSGTAVRIRALRESVALSQRDVEAQTGISQATLCRIERGDRAASAAQLRAIAHVLGVSVEHLAGASPVRARTVRAVRSEGPAVEAMFDRLLGLLEVGDLLDRHAAGGPA